MRISDWSSDVCSSDLLGSRVTVLEKLGIMPRDDPELVEIVRHALLRDGVDLREGADIARIERDGDSVAVVLRADGAEERVVASHVLVAAGRRPNVDDLDLPMAGVAHSAKGITVDAGLRTTTRRVYAVGDVVGGPQDRKRTRLNSSHQCAHRMP